MNFLKSRSLPPVILLSTYMLIMSCDRHTGDRVYIENGALLLGFDRYCGAFVSMIDKSSGHEFLDPAANDKPPWEIFYGGVSRVESLGHVAGSFSWNRPNRGTLEMRWENFERTEEENLQVVVRVSLDASGSLSRWSIHVGGLERGIPEEVNFPVVKGILSPEGTSLAVPTWTGQLIKDPGKVLSGRSDRTMKWMYPGYLSMQVSALYDSTGSGFYAAADDTLSCAKEFVFTSGGPGAVNFHIAHHPPLDEVKDTYSPSYRTIIGSFQGDWFTAAERYSDWAEKQWWCRDSRLKNRQTPSWLDSTALWVWNRKESEKVLQPARELKGALGLPVNVFWHWWHGCSYDDNFPEYFPPREGRESFRLAVSSALKEGVRPVVYMNSIQWGNSAKDFGSDEVRRNTVKDRSGLPHSHVYNLFTGTALTMMCMGTDFWRSTYAALCDSAIGHYGVSGIYLDQACLSRICYDPGHGHARGGGNYWFENYAKLTRQIRHVIPASGEIMLAGEGTGENWLPHLDAMLTLQVSRERYAGVDGIETIPFFQAVYHPYGITYGNYSSLLYPPYDDLWPEEYAPEKENELLGEQFSKQFLMEQARSFAWGQQPTIANYQSFLLSDRPDEMKFLFDLVRLRMQSLKYLLYGEFYRTPFFPVPEEEIDISRLSIYAGKAGNVLTAFRKRVPVIYHGTWRSDDGCLGLAIASISDLPLPVDLNFPAEEYGLSPAGIIYLNTPDGGRELSSYESGQVKTGFSLPPRSCCLVEIIPHRTLQRQ